MTETTARIRWERNEDDNSLTGRTGTMTDPVFWIWPPESPGKAHILTSSLPGHDKDFYPNGFVSDVKAKAEEWLAEHVASLGAVFPDEPGAMFEDVSEAEAFEEEFRARYAPGRRVRFSRPDAGYPADQEMASRLLTPGEVYTIEWSDIGFSSSSLGLAGIKSHGQGFNSVLFEPVDDETTTATAGEKEADR